MNFGSPNWLWCLWLLAPLGGLLVWNLRLKQRLLTQFISPRLLESLTSGVSKQRQKIRLALFAAGIALLTFALARPQLGFSLEESKQSGLDIVVAIDTSKSMLADDVRPNRLQRAKLAALDLMRLAQSDRLGLVAFAGSAFLQCPLSLDEEAFRQSVDFLDVNIIPQGGTAIAEAIAAARSAFKEETENHRVLVLFTDGEDHDDQGEALNAAREAHKAGLRIFTIGVGTPNGEVLSTTDPYGNRIFIKDAQGNVVKSRLNEPLLRQIAKETDGFYLPLTGARTMDVLYERGLAPLPKSEFSTRTIRQYHERFQWFIGAALVLLLAEMLFPERARNPKPTIPRPKPLVAVTALLLSALTFNVLGSVNEALKDYQRGKYSRARNEFERLARKSPDDSRLRFNAGAAAFKDQDYDSALKHFNSTLSAPDLKLQEQSYYNLGNTHFRVGEKATEPKAKMEQWEEAIRQYDSALRLESTDADAKFNREVVQKKLEELKKQQEQQKQKDQKDEQKKDDQQKQEKDKQQEQKQDDKDKQSEQQKQDQQKQDQEKKDQQSKEQQEQQQQQQQQQEQKKQDEQQASAQDNRGEKPDQSAQQQNYARVMQMTPQQAQQLLDAQKNEERAMIFQPQNLRTNRPHDRVFKDW